MTTRPVMSIIGAKDAVNTVTALLGGSATLNIITGAQPTETTDSDAGTVLASLTMSATAFANATNLTSNGVATAAANTITSATASNSGTAGHFNMASGTPTVIFMGNVGTSSADLNLNTTSISSGDTVAVTSMDVTLPCGDGAS